MYRPFCTYSFSERSSTVSDDENEFAVPKFSIDGEITRP